MFGLILARGTDESGFMRKDLLKFLLGFDGLHEESLDGKALAALCATTGENVAAALCRHEKLSQLL